MILLIAIGIVIESVNPMIYGKVIDSITNADKKMLNICLILFLGCRLLVHMLGVLETYIGQLTVSLIENDLKEKLFQRIISFRCSVLDEFMEGELFNRLEFDAETIVGYYIDIATNSIMIVCNFVISLCFIINISGHLTILAVMMIPILYLLNYISRHRIRILQELRKSFDDNYYGFVSEILGNIRGLKIFQLEKNYTEKYCDFLNEKYRIEKRTALFSGMISLVRNVISNGFDILIVYVSAMIIFNGGMTIGSMVAFNTYLSKLFEAVNKVLDINLNKHSIQVNYDRILELQNKEIECESEEHKVELSRIEKIKFENVSFGYGQKDVLKQINFELSKPDIYTIVGENGSGKSTLFKLIEKLYECDSGTVFVNDIPMEQYGINQIRNQICYLTKEPLLINGTIIENICIGKRDVSTEEVEKVCEVVGLQEDIAEFEYGYETEIGENGCKLSSGQKQKIGLTRMLLQDKSVILLDEATSALDSASRKKIEAVLEKLKEKAIIINISHNEQEIEKCKKIFVFHKGGLVGQGNHAILIKENKFYYQYFKGKKGRSK